MYITFASASTSDQVRHEPTLAVETQKRLLPEIKNVYGWNGVASQVRTIVRPKKTLH